MWVTRSAGEVSRAAVPAAAPGAGANVMYRVIQGGGETMYIVAQRTLGDGSRWQEIASLNPNYDVRYSVPANAVPASSAPGSAKARTPQQ